MSEKLKSAKERYQQAAKGLEDKLVEAFKAHRKKTGNKLWEPLSGLRTTADVPELEDVIEEVEKNIGRLIIEFGQEQSKRNAWDKIKSGFKKFVGWTVPTLKNFMMATQGAQSVT